MRRQKKILRLILLFAFYSIFISCRNTSHTPEQSINKKPNDFTEKACNYVDSLINEMTLEERVGQCLMPSISSNSDKTNIVLLKKYIKDYHIGGIVLLKGTRESVEKLKQIGSESGVPLFVAIDAEWGLGMRLEDAPVYPKNRKLAETADENFMYDYGCEIAEECRAIGINMVLGPVVDLTSKETGVIGNRSFGKDPNIVANLGISYGKGLESGGVISIAKHFPGHGSTVADSHKSLAKIHLNISEMDSLDLKPFRDYARSGLTGIMAGHIQALALDPSGKAATVSEDMLTNLLREEIGFKGLILTDAFDMGGATGFSAAAALRAGADIILCPRDVETEYHNLLKEIIDGQLDISILNDRCRRILFYKYIFNLF